MYIFKLIFLLFLLWCSTSPSPLWVPMVNAALHFDLNGLNSCLKNVTFSATTSKIVAPPLIVALLTDSNLHQLVKIRSKKQQSLAWTLLTVHAYSVPQLVSRIFNFYFYIFVVDRWKWHLFKVIKWTLNLKNYIEITNV